MDVQGFCEKQNPFFCNFAENIATKTYERYTFPFVAFGRFW